MNRHLVIAAALALVGALGFWTLLGPGTGDAMSDRSPAVSVPPDDPESDKRVVRFDPEPSAVPEPEPNDAIAVPSDPRWATLHGRYRSVMGGRIEVVVPDDATPFEAQDLRLDAIDARATELDDLIVELTELAETTTDPPTKVDALVSLGEVYLELSANVESTPVPDFMKPRRAQRLENDIANRSAIAVDKARMVFQMAQGAGGGAVGAEMAGRIRAGLEAAE